MADEVGSRVRVRIELEVDSTGGGWGDDATIGEARRQGLESCLESLQKALSEFPHIRVCGPPTVVEVVSRPRSR